jgi:hypothetical protein
MSWALKPETKEYIVDEMGEGSAQKGCDALIEFYKKYIGKERDIENKARMIDVELKKIREDAEKNTGILEENLKKREDKIKKIEMRLEVVGLILKE